MHAKAQLHITLYSSDLEKSINNGNDQWECENTEP